MNFSFPVVFVVLGLMFVLCDDCSRELYDAFTRSRQLTEKCYENCLIHDSEIISGEKNWTGLCFRNRHLFFSDWQCRDKDFEIADVGLFVLATHNFCTIKTPNDVQVTDLDCLRKFNAKQCSINNNKIINSTFYEKNRTDIDRGSLQIGEENTPLYTFRSPSVSTPNGSFNNNRSLTIFSKIPVSGQSTNNGTETSIFREEKTTSGSTVKVPELHKWLSTTGSAPNPCESYEKFFNDYCYFLKNFKHIIKEDSIPNGKENQSLDDGTFLSKLSGNSTKSCRLQHPDALGLSVETKKENRFVMDFLKSVEYPFQSLILTSGIKEKGNPGQWQDWHLEVDENVIDCKSTLTSEIMLYVINPVTFAWQFFNASSLFAVSNNEWFVMCKRLHKRRLVQDDLHNRCMKLYRASQCYMPFKFIDYCCAVDENGELWFGCPNEIRIKEDKDGSQCAWNCGDDGMFVQEYPICRRNTACTASFHGIQYSAPIGRHAISRCPKGFSGYSSWYCMSNKTFQGIPNYTCCNTTQLCKTVDPYLNIWISCPSNKATKKVMCPSDALLTEATVEWHCTSQFVFNGTSPNYSNCNRTDVVCLETDRYKREWKAAGGTVAQKPCPDSVKEMCYWKCNEIGRFETPEPDCSKCSVDSLDEIFEKIKNGTHYKVVMEIVENYTKVGDLALGFSHVLNITSSCVDLYKRQIVSNESSFNDFLIDYSKILKNVVKKSEIWTTFLVSSRREYADKILKITQNATFAYLTFQAGSAEENAYNATLADSQNDGFDFFVLYGSSLTGKKFPLQNYHDSDWILEVKDVSNKFGSNFAAMGLIMNHSLGHLMFPAGNQTMELEMNSPAVTFTVATSEANKSILVHDVCVSLTFKHITRTRFPESKVIKRRIHEGEKPSGIYGSTVCYYFSYSGWTNQDCSVTFTSRDLTMCTCKHLSTIALLMSVHRYEPDTVLEMISLVSSAVSIVALILTIMVFITFDSIKNERVLIGVNLSVCLIAGHFLLITVMDKKFFYISDTLCSAYAILLHYAFMAAFAWMFVEGCHLYRMLVLVFESDVEFRFIYVLIGYGMPILVIGVTELIGFLFREQPYGQDELCWLKTPNYVWAFNGPVVVLTSINFIILIMAMKLAIAAKIKTEKSNFSNLKLWIKGCISLSALLGITWLLGIAYVHFNQLFAYSFVILNGLQGFFIFLFRCVCNVQYKTALLQKLKSCFPDSDELINYKKLENIKSGTKVFAITQSGIKSSGSESDNNSTLLNRFNKKIYTRKNFLKKYLTFSFSRSKGQANDCRALEESSCGFTMDLDGVLTSSQGSNFQSVLLAENLTSKPEEDATRKQELGTTWWKDLNDFPELSYHYTIMG